MHDLFVEQFILVFEVGNIQRAHSLDGRTKRLVGRTRTAWRSQALARGPKDAENLRPIKSLTFTMLAKAHIAPRLG